MPTFPTLKPILSFAAALALIAAGPAFGHESEAESEATEPNTGAVSLSAGLDVTTHYFFRGALQEDQGLIAQPWAEIGLGLYEGDGPINSIGFNVGIWNSFHDQQTGAQTDADGPDSWYEADLYAGFSATLFDDVTAGISYVFYTSPNDAFDTIEELDLTLGYDDRGAWAAAGVEDFALNPSATLAIEIDNTLLGRDEGVYLELGIAPAFAIIQSEDQPVTLTIPVTVGLGLDNYYDGDTDGEANNDTFGFVDVGLDFSTPLTFVPADLGEWELGAGVHFLFLGDNNESLNNGDDFEAVGTLSLSMSY